MLTIVRNTETEDLTRDYDEPGDAEFGIVRFIEAHRRGLVTGVLVAAAAIVALAVGLSLRDRAEERSLAAFEDFNKRYEDLQGKEGEEGTDEAVQKLLADLAAFGEAPGSGKKFAAAEALALSGRIREGRKEWAEAEAAWTAASGKAAGTFLYPAALFHAAVACEEQGKVDEALELYQKSAAYPGGFPAAARAQFSVGRLLEGQGKTDAAIEAYQEIGNKWSGETTWVNLAQSRIILLSGAQR